MFNVRLAGGHLYGKQLFTCLSLVVSLMAPFVLSFFPLDVLDEIWDLIESVSEGFLTYSFIDLPSIFRDKSVQSSIPNYFKNYEVSIICYKYNKPIRALYLISINLFLILISKLVTLTPETARTLSMFIRLRVMLLRQSENHF